MSKQNYDIYSATIMDSLHQQQNEKNDNNNNDNIVRFTSGSQIGKEIKFIKEGIKDDQIVDEPDNLGQSFTITSHEIKSTNDISISTQEEGQNITLLSLPSQPISLEFEETKQTNDKEIQTEISCVNPNIRLAIDYNTDRVTTKEMTSAKQYTNIINFMDNLVQKDNWLLPPVNYNTLDIKENKRQWFFNSEHCKTETKMQNIKKYRREGKTREYAQQHLSCAEALLTLISIINFQQITIDEIAKDNAELAGLINKYNPQIKRFNELLKRIIKDSDKKSLNCINNQITKFSWRILHEEMSDSNLYRISAQQNRGDFLDSNEYQNKIRKCLISCKNYLNGCYSKNVNKNRRILYEMYRIFGMIKEPEPQEEISLTESSDEKYESKQE